MLRAGQISYPCNGTCLSDRGDPAVSRHYRSFVPRRDSHKVMNPFPHGA